MSSHLHREALTQGTLGGAGPASCRWTWTCCKQAGLPEAGPSHLFLSLFQATSNPAFASTAGPHPLLASPLLQHSREPPTAQGATVGSQVCWDIWIFSLATQLAAHLPSTGFPFFSLNWLQATFIRCHTHAHSHPCTLTPTYTHMHTQIQGLTWRAGHSRHNA